MGSDFRCSRCILSWFLLLTVCYYSMFSLAANSSATSIIAYGRSLRDGETIISDGKRYEMGFFSPQGSSFRYLGIWFQGLPVQSVVWVANRESPISGNGGVVTMAIDGNLKITDGGGKIVWSSNTTAVSSNSTAMLLDTGNLVILASERSKLVLWQSFDFPTDTYLPDMELHMDANGGERRIFSSWKSAADPSPGNFTMGVDPRGSPQIVMWEGTNRRFRSGHWNGQSFIGVPDLNTIYLFGFKLTNLGDGRLYFRYVPSDDSLVKFQINWDGVERQGSWNDERKEWRLVQSRPFNQCEFYGHCGPFGKCNELDGVRCRCLEGFVAKDSYQWSRGNWSGGCTRKTPLQCGVVRRAEPGLPSVDGVTDSFWEVQNLKLPDFVDNVGLGVPDIKGCRELCLSNCSCTAFAFVSGINCMIWTRDLLDVQQFSEGGNSLFLRLASSELSGKKYVARTIIITTAIIGTFLLCVAAWLLFNRSRIGHVVSDRNEMPRVSGLSREHSFDSSGATDLGVSAQQANGTELAMFSFNTLVAATNNFSNMNKLGQGGFGHVYKGILPDGQEIAVKRLSRKSDQGLQEFKNEIVLIAKLQHRNLVRLLGCCIQGEEKILLYEYMPNKGLDSYLFDPEKKPQLDWSIRFSIIKGIARGLLYLHRDSRLRIIHRDLKASNILLDEEMNPKISDFGMARIFGGNQNEANTNTVVGTYGYMAPEYAMEGLFSLKSDVYSFGVLLLEIITGQRNSSMRSSDFSNMIAYAWDLWDKERETELFDSSILKSYIQEQVLRCIHVGMLCVQDIAGHRPNMPAVLLMLESENMALPAPRPPTFTSMRHDLDEDLWNVNQDAVSSNNITVSVILGR